MSRKYIVSHIKSTKTVDKNLLDEGYPSMSDKMAQRPDTEAVVDGEIAVNYARGHETLTIRSRDVDDTGAAVEDGTQEMVGFLSEKVTYENEKIVSAAMVELQNQTATKVADLKENLTQTILENELTAAGGITSLEAKKADLVHVTQFENETAENRNDNELVAASAIASIVGRKYGYYTGGSVNSNGYDLSLSTLSARLDILETSVASIIERVTALEDTITADDIKQMAGLS